MASASASEVRGPLATITGPAGISVTSSSTMVMLRWLRIFSSPDRRTQIGHPASAPTRFYTGRVSALQNQTVQAAHFLFEQAHRIGKSFCAQRVGTAELCKIRCMMGRRHLLRLHLMEPDPGCRAPPSARQPRTRPVPRQLPQPHSSAVSAFVFFLVVLAAGFFAAVLEAAFFVVFEADFAAVFLAGFFSSSAVSGFVSSDAAGFLR